jgi:predicted alpha/beta-hydrolase family hydrolase
MWAAEKPDAWNGDLAVILAHGAGQGMNSPFMTFFQIATAARGFLSVKFNFAYMEAKRKIPDPQPKLQATYRRVIEEIRLEYNPRRFVIGGKSMGGRIASYVAGDIAGVIGLVFLGYPLHPPGKPEQLRDEHLYKLNLPMLFISGTRDNFAQRELLARVTARIGKRAAVCWIEGGDHSLKTARNDKESLQVVARMMLDWLSNL